MNRLVSSKSSCERIEAEFHFAQTVIVSKPRMQWYVHINYNLLCFISSALKKFDIFVKFRWHNNPRASISICSHKSFLLGQPIDVIQNSSLNLFICLIPEKELFEFSHARFIKIYYELANDKRNSYEHCQAVFIKVGSNNKAEKDDHVRR